MCRRVPVPDFQYDVRSAQVRLYCFWLQLLPDRCCGLLELSMGVHQQGASDGLGESPCHVVVVVRVVAEGCRLVNQTDGFGGHPEGVSGLLWGGGSVLQVIEGLELPIDPAEFRGRG